MQAMQSKMKLDKIKLQAVSEDVVLRAMNGRCARVVCVCVCVCVCVYVCVLACVRVF